MICTSNICSCFPVVDATFTFLAGTDDLEGAVVIELVGIDVVGGKLNGASDVGLEVVVAFEGVELVGGKMRVGLDDGSGLGDLLGVAVGVTVGAVLLGATVYFMFPALCGLTTSSQTISLR